MRRSEAFSFFAAGGENDFQAAALAFHWRAVFELYVHRLDIRIDVMDADARLIAGVLWKFLECSGVHFHRV